MEDKLDEYIDPLNKLPVYFKKYGIMTRAEADKFDCTEPLATRELLKKMMEFLEKDSKNCVPILKALNEDDQMHIAKFIASSGKNTRSPDRVLTKEQKVDIDQNMFCLDKFIRPHVNDYVVRLAGQKCITDLHKQWIFKWRKQHGDVYQLFEIMKRRSFKHLIIFYDLLLEKGHKITAEILAKGGISEIISSMEGIEHFFSDRKKKIFERRIIEKLRVYVNEDNGNKLYGKYKSIIDAFITSLNERDKRIRLFGCFLTNSIALYFQCETIESQEWLENFCKNGGLKSRLEALYRTLQPALDRFQNFYIEVSMTNFSKIHSMDIQNQYNSGNNFTNTMYQS